MKVRLNLPTAAQLIRDKGLAPDGDVQRFHTQNVLKRIKRYMPYVSGATYKITVAQKMIDPKINASGFLTPEGWRSRRGSVKVLTAENLKYNKTKNPAAGPRWDRALVAAEGKALVADLQSYIDRRKA